MLIAEATSSASFMSDVHGEPFLNEILSFDDSETSDTTTANPTSTENNPYEIGEATSENEFESYFGETNNNPDDDIKIDMPPQRRCVSHLLNRLSHDFETKFLNALAKKALFQTLKKLHSLWVLLHRSTHAKSICKTVLGRILKIHNDTRWNSRFDAVKMCCEAEIQKNLNNLIQQLKTDLKCPSAQNLQLLNARDFSVMDYYVKVFEPVAVALDVMQGEFNSSQGFIVPVLQSMKTRIATIEENNKDGTKIHLIKDFKTAMLDAINSRFKNYFLFEDFNKDLLLAAITLPHIKTRFIKNDDDIIFTKNLLIAECKKLKNASSDASQEEIEHDVLQDDFIISYSRDVRRNSIESEIESEVSRFLCDIRLDSSILNEYPNVKAVYFKYNTTISSSAPVERVFSQSLMIFTPRRNRLSALHFEQALLMKHNRKLLTEAKRI